MRQKDVGFTFASNLKTQYDPNEVEKMTISKFLSYSQKVSDETTNMKIEDIPIIKVVLTPVHKIYKAIKSDEATYLVNRM
jgi:hypothetical protein